MSSLDDDLYDGKIPNVEVKNNKRILLTNEQDEPSVKKEKMQSEEDIDTKCQRVSPTCLKTSTNVIANHQHQSPKKRLEVNLHTSPKQQHTNSFKTKEKFIYGNYSKYYGYRNKGEVFHDIRLDVFETHKNLFHNKDILDIGCNSGLITLELAKRFSIKHITGIDIDPKLINQASKNVKKQRKATERSASSTDSFPFNITFLQANYVLRDDVLLEIEREQFDVILCLSVTKWIHLNFGDAGLKQSFKRMFLQLRSGGHLILEAQPFDNYGRRKKMTTTIFENYKAMQFFPKDFTNYLLSSQVGFKSVSLLGVPDHCVAGFKRPIQIFNKD